MSRAQEMLQTHPSGSGANTEALAETIDSCLECEQACTACADACMAEGDLEMLARCIKLDLDCADVCGATVRILSRRMAFDPEMVRPAVEACARAVKLCGDECEQHAEHHEHCRVCMEACRRCEEACNQLLQEL